MNRVTAGILAVAVAQIVWGFTTPALKVALEEIPLFSALFIRFALATLLVLPIFLSRPYKRIEAKDLAPLIMVAVVGIFLHMILFAFGLSKTSVVNAALILAVAPVIEVVAASIFLREKVQGIHKLGISLGLVGTSILILQPVLFNGHSVDFGFWGNLIIFVSVILGTIFVIGSKEFFVKYSPLTIGTYCFVVTTLALAPFSLAETLADPTWISEVTSHGIAAIVFSGLFASLIAYLLYEWGLARAEVQLIAPLNYLTAPVSILIGIFLLGESVGPTFFLSGTVILIGVFLATYQKPHHHASKRHRS